MAGIDKTYCDDYDEYRAFKDWIDTQSLTLYTGNTVCPGDYVPEIARDEFVSGMAVMNTFSWLDAFFIQNIKDENHFVIKRMKQVYNEKIYNELKTHDFNVLPRGYEKNRSFKIRRNPERYCMYPCSEKAIRRWWIQIHYSKENSKFYQNWSYSSDFNCWVGRIHPHNTNTQTLHGNVRAVIRSLKKQYLPKGIQFSLEGYVGESYIITTL